MDERRERRADHLALQGLMENLAEEADTLATIRQDYLALGQALDKRAAAYERGLRDRLEGTARRLTRMVVGLAIVLVVSLAANGYLLREQTRIQREQVEGRRIAINALCGGTSGVIEAGRAVIATAGRTPEERAKARLRAVTYSRQIAQSIASEVGVTAIVNKDGTLNCDVLRQRAAADK